MWWFWVNTKWSEKNDRMCGHCYEKLFISVLTCKDMNLMERYLLELTELVLMIHIAVGIMDICVYLFSLLSPSVLSCLFMIVFLFLIVVCIKIIFFSFLVLLILNLCFLYFIFYLPYLFPFSIFSICVAMTHYYYFFLTQALKWQVRVNWVTKPST